MAFASLPFLVFLLVTLAAYWAAARRPRLRHSVLIAASYFFYGNFHPAFIALLFAVSMADFRTARAIASSEGGRRRALVTLSVAVNLALLGSFKYLNFFGRGAADLLSLAGMDWDFEPLPIPLPVGLSFYVFQSISYAVDVYRKRLPPTESAFAHLAYMAFFPRLVAGPIVRAGEFVPQLAPRPRLSREDFGLAVFLLITGFVKKMAIADFLRENIVDRVFDFPAMYQTAEVLVASFAYSIQIYGDFAGYTDIALGLALLFGLRLPENFNFPYLATSLREFWHRWHISLSAWLRDYLYISLGGNRASSLKVYRNLMITMVLGGLWHGAAWSFVIWGALHGGALAVTRYWQRRTERRGVVKEHGPVMHAFLVVCTFIFVTIAWVFFRADDMRTISDMAGQLGTMTWRTTNVSARVWIVMGLAAAGMWCPPRLYEKLRGLFVRAPVPVQIGIGLAVGYGLYRFSSSALAPFVYEKF
ncbi:MAG: MBOAT family protein [Deltaproteobacteria bacterium]|nr:MBOAT family protein [Deltaproteobacteria bacterium]